MQKPWWQSKTKWAGILLAASQAAAAIPALAPYLPFINALGVALGIFGVRDAMGQAVTR